MPLSAPEYLEHIRAESARFVDVIATCDPATAVPSCPEWTAGDLLWHLGDVQEFWARVLQARPTKPEISELDRPADYDDLLATYRDAAESLTEALERADPAEPAWSWRRRDDTVAFILRRQAHEALIHRVDAELTAATASDVDPRLAADGVVECLDVMYGGQPDWGRWIGSDDYVRLDCTDTADQVWVRLGRFNGTHPETGEETKEEDFHVVGDPGQDPAATVTGSAVDLDCWLWHRRDDSNLQMAGDGVVLARLLAVLRQPIN